VSREARGREARPIQEKWEYTIVRPFLEAGQRGFVVGVEVKRGKSAKERGRVDLSVYRPIGTGQRAADEAYRRASLAVEGIKRGAFLGSYQRGVDEFHFSVDGKKLTIRKGSW
jgi:hypothetical protein